MLVFFFKQKTAYEVRISDWSSDVCSSDLRARRSGTVAAPGEANDSLHRTPPSLPRHLHRNLVRSWTDGGAPVRSEERRVGKECVSTCRSRWSTYHSNKKYKTKVRTTMMARMICRL